MSNWCNNCFNDIIDNKPCEMCIREWIDIKYLEIRKDLNSKEKVSILPR